MKLKKINEFFDTEDWKDKYEIPYLKGEMEDEISKFKKLPFNKIGTETTELFFENVILEYPILGKFHNKVINVGDDKMIGMLPKDILDKTVKNPETGRNIKVKSALKYDDDSQVKKNAMSMVQMLKK